MKALKQGIFAVGVLVATALSPASAQYSEAEAPAGLRSGAQDTIDQQFSAFRAREHEKAFSHAAPRLQKLFGSTERFIGMVKGGYGAIYNARTWQFGRSRMKDGVLFQEVIVNGPKGKDWMALYELKQEENGSWKIQGVRLVPASTRST